MRVIDTIIIILYKIVLPTSATDGLAPLLRGEAAGGGGAHRGGHRPARARLVAGRQYGDGYSR